MSLNTYPYNPFPASTDKLDEAHNAELQQEVDAVKSGLTNLQNDVEGAWEELTFADVVTMSQDVTLSSTPSEAYRRGNRIRLRIYPTGTLTISGGGYKLLGTLSNAYKPSYQQLCAGLVNKAASGATIAPVSYVINVTGNINLIYGSAGTIGNETHGWMDGSSIWLEWSLS